MTASSLLALIELLSLTNSMAWEDYPVDRFASVILRSDDRGQVIVASGDKQPGAGPCSPRPFGEQPASIAHMCFSIIPAMFRITWS
jgi:hypothetical protein